MSVNALMNPLPKMK